LSSSAINCKVIVRRLVAEGQLDFTNGGWCA